jgi:glucosamine--fructose-6-phosphate aminotransferase (isomerizing)
MRAEILEQPKAWTRLLQNGLPHVNAVADAVARRNPRFVLFAARGTSDHAAIYGKYLAEILYGRPAGLVSPSTTSLYDAKADHRDVLLVAVSQSGGSPDLVQSVEAARRGGALTVSVTNNPESALASAAEFSIDVGAGPELAVAATKSYTAELLALYLFFARLAGAGQDGARGLPDAAYAVLSSPAAESYARRLRFVERMVATGRGFSYPTALEAALKLMETSYVSAQAFSAADLMHGPLAMVDHRVPVLAVVPEGREGRAMQEVLSRARAARSEVFCVGSAAAVAAATAGTVLPAGLPEMLSPPVQILPFQELALHLALERGENPDLPRGLKKVTQTL